MNLSELKKLIQEEVENTLVPHLEKIKPDEIEEILDVGDKALGTFMNHSNTVSKNPNINFKKEADWGKSIKLVVGDLIIGYYLLSDKKTINDFLDEVEKYNFEITINNQELFDYSERNNGTQGLSIGILPEYKGKGYSSFLFNYPKSLGYKYIWGVKTKGLSNLDNWLKRAKLLLTMTHPSGQEFYITMEKF